MYPKFPARSSILKYRGGAEEDDEYDEYDEDEDSEDESKYELDDEDFNVNDDDFAEDNLLDGMVSQWGKTPPFTKCYLSAAFAATVYGYLVNKNQFPEVLLLKWTPTVKKLQLWRPITAFLNVGSFGIFYPLTLHFVWTYMSTLERLNHDRPYDFWIMILFGCASMLAGYGFLKMSPKFLGHNLSTFLVYVWSKYHEGQYVNMFELFNAKAELLPWLFLLQTFLLEGEPPTLDFLGIVFGHIYHYFKTIGMLQAPRFLVDWYNSDNEYSKRIRDSYKDISADFGVQ